MERMNRLCASLFLLLACSITLAQVVKSEPRTPAQVLDKGLIDMEKDFVSAAEAMPEDKYSFAPTNGEFKGVRTFAQQVKHVAAVNYVIAGAILGEKPPVDTGGEKGPDSIQTKADIIKFLKDSLAYAHKSVAGITESNLVTPVKDPFGEHPTTRLELATTFQWHAFDHYGQMVEYLRMNRIIPPASR
jgi:DinB superfamily